MGSAYGYTLNMLGEKIVRHLIERNDNKQTTKDITNVIELKYKKKSFSDIVFYHFQHDFFLKILIRRIKNHMSRYQKIQHTPLNFGKHSVIY